MRKAKIKKVALIILTAVLLAVSVMGFRIWGLYSSVDNFHAYWAAQTEKQPDNGMLWYVALGDSAAVGIGASSPVKGYVSLLTAELSERSGRSVHTINLARSGAKLSDVLENQLPKLKLLNLPEDAVATIDIGSNNMKEFSRESFESEFDKILEKLPPQTIVADLPYFGPDSHRHGGRNVKQANEIIRALIRKHGLRLAEVYDHTKSNKSLKYYAADFFHPNDRGYRSWFDAFFEAMEAENS